MVILGLLEGVILSLYCLIHVFFLEISLLQVMLSLSVGSVYGVFYFIALLCLLRLDKSNQIQRKVIDGIIGKTTDRKIYLGGFVEDHQYEVM